MRRVDNKVVIEGYLRENTLELTKNSNNEEVIRGSITIATDKDRSYRVQFYANKFKALKAGETALQGNKNYEKLVALLPVSTTSIASILRDSPSADFDTAKVLASKVWIFGSLQEYLRKNEKGDVISTPTIKGLSAGFKEVTDKHPFDPKAQFTVEMYVENKVEEVVNDEETGRVILTGLLPEYDESVSRVDFVTALGDVSTYVRENFDVGQTVKVWGDLINLYIRSEKAAPAGSTFGQAVQPQYETTFVHERQILGGNGQAWDESDELGLSKKEIKGALVVRQQKIDELPIMEATPAGRPANGFTDSSKASAKKFKFDGQF